MASYIRVEVDLEDVIAELDEAQIKKIAEMSPDYDDDDKAAAVDAINAIRGGRYNDAITALERQFLPKWRDVDACQRAYREAFALEADRT